MEQSPDLIRSFGLLAERLGTVQDRDQLGTVLFEFLENHLRIHFISLFLYDVEQERLRAIVNRGFTDEQIAIAEESVMDRHPGQCFKENRVLHIPDTRNPEGDQHHTTPRDFEVLSSLVMPVRSDEKAVGVLTMASDEVGYFQPWMHDILLSACNITGIAYRNLMRVEEQRKLMSELIAAKRDAEMANGEKTLFLANVSHELRTPIHGLRGLIDLMRQATDEGQKDRYIAFTSQSLGQLETVVEDLLDISMSHAGRLVIRDDWFALEKLIPGLVIEFQNLAAEKGLEFSVEMGESPDVEVLADAARIRQALSILLSNAIKYTPQGTITFHAGCSIQDNTKELQFKVSDTGMGISETDLPRIFDPFFRSNDLKKTDLKGSGLGLAVCKEIVDQMGGTITASSKAGEGSTFVLGFSLPCRPRGLEENEGESDDDALSGARILVAEDSEVNQLVIANILEQFGVELVIVSNGEQAWQTCQQAEIDLIIMDLQMPSMNGIEAIEAIRKDGKTTPAIALTANSDQRERERCINAGFDAYMNKPFDAISMRQAMLNLLKG